VRILYSEKLEPGEKGYVQITLEDPVVARRGDRFIIRRFSPVVTIGGGVVIDPYPERKRLGEKEYINEFELFKSGQVKDIVIHLLDKAGFEGLSLGELKHKTAEREDLLGNILTSCEKEGSAFKLAESYFSSSVKERGKRRILNTLSSFFKKNSFAIGIDREELRSRAAIENRRLYGLILNEMLSEGAIVLERDLINLPGRIASLS
jgi:selenocysteine-specific elongation factor